MTSETQQKLLKALDRMMVELDGWLKELGRSEDELIPIYASILRENGIAAQLVANQTAQVLPSSTRVELTLGTFAQELDRVRSGEYAAWLIKQPEPAPEALAELLNGMNNALPNLRQHLHYAAKTGPRYKRGGRPKELDDLATREKIRTRIKELREPGTHLRDIYKKLGREYKVSPTTIKRIREEKSPGKP